MTVENNHAISLVLVGVLTSSKKIEVLPLKLEKKRQGITYWFNYQIKLISVVLIS